MLARDDIDAVLIAAAYHASATNAIWRPGPAKTSTARSRPACTIRAGRAVVEAVRAHGRVYQGGTQQRSEYGGKFRQAVELVRGGRDRPAASGSTPIRWAAASARPPRPPAAARPAGRQLGGLRRPAALVQLRRQHRRPSLRLGRHQLGPAPLRHRAMGPRRGRHRPRGNPPGERASRSTAMPTAWRSTAALRPARHGTRAGPASWGPKAPITVHRNVFTADPPELIRQSSAPERARGLLLQQPLGEFPGVRPHPSADDLRRGDRPPRSQPAAAGRHRHADRPDA